MMALRIAPFLSVSLTQPSCIEVVLGCCGLRGDIDVTVSISKSTAEELNYFELSQYLRQPIVQAELMNRLIPETGEITWYDTIEATVVFLNPDNIRDFFKTVREIYPEFDADYANFRAGNNAAMLPQRWKFIAASNVQARRTLIDFFAIDPAQHDAIVRSNMYASNAISQLEEAIERVLWRWFDSRKEKRKSVFDRGWKSEPYIVFPKKINPLWKKKIMSKINWRNFDDDVTVVQMPHGYSRLALSFEDPLQTESLNDFLGTDLWELDGAVTYPMVGRDRFKDYWLLDDDVQGFLPEHMRF